MHLTKEYSPSVYDVSAVRRSLASSGGYSASSGAVGLRTFVKALSKPEGHLGDWREALPL